MLQLYYIPVWKNGAKYERCPLLYEGLQFVSKAESELQPQRHQSGAASLEV